jgi:hypothetical protein
MCGDPAGAESNPERARAESNPGPGGVFGCALSRRARSHRRPSRRDVPTRRVAMWSEEGRRWARTGGGRRPATEPAPETERPRRAQETQPVSRCARRSQSGVASLSVAQCVARSAARARPRLTEMPTRARSAARPPGSRAIPPRRSPRFRAAQLKRPGRSCESRCPQRSRAVVNGSQIPLGGNRLR